MAKTRFEPTFPKMSEVVGEYSGANISWPVASLRFQIFTCSQFGENFLND